MHKRARAVGASNIQQIRLGVVPFRGPHDVRHGMCLYLTTSRPTISVDFPSDVGTWPELAKVVENARG